MFAAGVHKLRRTDNFTCRAQVDNVLKRPQSTNTNRDCHSERATRQPVAWQREQFVPALQVPIRIFAPPKCAWPTRQGAMRQDSSRKAVGSVQGKRSKN